MEAETLLLGADAGDGEDEEEEDDNELLEVARAALRSETDLFPHAARGPALAAEEAEDLLAVADIVFLTRVSNILTQYKNGKAVPNQIRFL